VSTNLDIEIIEKGRFKILKLKGRIDANWSLRLSESINEVIRGGAYDIILDAAEVDYISSAGVRVLLMSYKELNKLNGSFALYRPCENVKSIINMMGLSSLFDCSKFEVEMSGRPSTEDCKSHSIDASKVLAAAGESVAVKNPSASKHSAPNYGVVNGMSIDVAFKKEYSAAVKISGNINKISSFSYSADDMRVMPAGAKTIAFGLGALGPGGAKALERAGEFISTGGFTAYMPSDGSKKPDYLIAGSGFTPQINYLYCASCECSYSAAFSFKSASAGAVVRLSDIIKTAHGVAGCDDILAVIIGETEGVVGVSLAVPPAAVEKKYAPARGNEVEGVKTSVEGVDRYSGGGCEERGPFEFPQIRDNFNITSEPAFGGHMAVCAGLSCIKPVLDKNAAEFLRPMAVTSNIYGHFHASVFEFTPLKKNCTDPAELMAALYEKGSPEAVFHLINDWRDINGAGETGFISGTCWIVKISGYEYEYPVVSQMQPGKADESKKDHNGECGYECECARGEKEDK